MAYKPNFICPYCARKLTVEFSSMEQGLLTPCDCIKSRQAWELAHRQEMELRKKKRRH